MLRQYSTNGQHGAFAASVTFLGAGWVATLCWAYLSTAGSSTWVIAREMFTNALFLAPVVGTYRFIVGGAEDAEESASGRILPAFVYAVVKGTELAFESIPESILQVSVIVQSVSEDISTLNIVSFASSILAAGLLVADLNFEMESTRMKEQQTPGVHPVCLVCVLLSGVLYWCDFTSIRTVTCSLLTYQHATNRHHRPTDAKRPCLILPIHPFSSMGSCVHLHKAKRRSSSPRGCSFRHTLRAPRLRWAACSPKCPHGSAYVCSCSKCRCHWRSSAGRGSCPLARTILMSSFCSLEALALEACWLTSGFSLLFTSWPQRFLSFNFG